MWAWLSELLAFQKRDYPICYWHVQRRNTLPALFGAFCFDNWFILCENVAWKSVPVISISGWFLADLIQYIRSCQGESWVSQNRVYPNFVLKTWSPSGFRWISKSCPQSSCTKPCDRNRFWNRLQPSEMVLTQKQQAVALLLPTPRYKGRKPLCGNHLPASGSGWGP